jgi:Rieske Fe-S protein
MGTGLAAGYGTLAYMAGRYLFPADSQPVWMFVTDVASFPPGESRSFESPDGIKAVITRRSTGSDAAATGEDFTALSSVCPHLGCRVHWEAANNRFFCPCHNGSFDPQGRPTGGPPLAANQSLPGFHLEVQQGRLLIAMPAVTVGRRSRRPGGTFDPEA